MSGLNGGLSEEAVAGFVSDLRRRAAAKNAEAEAQASFRDGAYDRGCRDGFELAAAWLEREVSTWRLWREAREVASA